MRTVRPTLSRFAALLGSTLLAGGASALYIYVPNVLVVSSGEDADSVLSEFEARYDVTFGVTAADDPLYADRPDLKRVDRVTKVMERHWQRLDAECDANAVFALMYLVTTYNIRNHTRDGYFADNDYLAVITVSFAKLYLDAYEAWKAGDRANVPLGWQEAFDHATSHQSSIVEDEFLGMNAHINYDLSVAIASLGSTAPDGTSRKPDMDRVNHVLMDATDDVGWYIAHYYGPAPPSTEPDWGHNEAYTGGEEALIEAIGAWREHAWHNAVAIETMPDATTREAHDASMQEYSWTVAQGLQSPKLQDPWPARLAYCEASA
ncbi:MAG: DUF5995 family protein [Methanobacteriota archaeon]